MPVDSTRTAPTRRAQRKVTEEELKDIELKRIRGELSCAECRRLKLRCDKKVPCGSCCRRGCESICPCGILSAGQGTRFILADTDQLHRKISEMSHRIRQLEDALAILQSAVSGERHPLLQDELLRIKFGAEALNTPQSPPQTEEEPIRQSIDALGTLTLDDAGEVKYFGRSAGSETLMMASETLNDPSREEDEDEGPRVALTEDLENLSNLFPFTSKRRPNKNTLEHLESYLPVHERAWSLCETYLNHGAYFFRPIKREELINTFLPSVYNTASARVQARVAADTSPGIDKPGDPSDSSSPHALATLFFLFALGALLDLELPPYNAEAEHYYDLGRSALSLRPVFDSPQVDTVQAMGLMATYHSLAGKKYSRDSAWCLGSFAAKLAQSIGLHRDSARWKMDPSTVQKRRNLFWEIFAVDVSHSLALGRPPAIHPSYVDCEFPIDEEASLSDEGRIQSGFWHMKHIFARDIFMGVAEATLTAKSPSYGTVLDLDRRVREISFPANFKPYVRREDGEEEYHSSSLSLRGFYASQHRTVTMLYLHRSFFAQAMLDHPTNPLLSPFATSFLTAYRCASIIIQASAHQFDRCAEMAMRLWFLLYHTFSAAVIVGTVVTRSPNSNIASNALLDLGVAVDLFERTALQSQRARIALGVLRKLKEKAVSAYTQYSSSVPTSPNAPDNAPPNPFSPSLLSSPSSADDTDDELAIFGGQTRVLSRKSRSKHSPNSCSITDSPSPSTEPPASPPAMRTDPRSPLIHAASTTTPSNMQTAPGYRDLATHPEVSMSLPVYGPENSSGLSVLSNPYARNGHGPSNSGGVNRLSPEHLVHNTPVGELFSSFLGYLTNRTINNHPAAIPNLLPNPGHDLHNIPNIPPQGWNKKEPSYGHDRNDSFEWLPPAVSIPNSVDFALRHNPPLPPNVNADMADNTRHWMNSMPASNPGAVTPRYDIPGVSQFENGFGSEPAATASTGAMVELGLSTESGMDAGWVSFMRDCGIMENGRSL